MGGHLKGATMVKRLHIVPEANEANGMFQVARMLAVRDGGELRDTDGAPYVVDGVAFENPADWARFATKDGVGHPVEWFDEVWVHGMWLPKEWAACRAALCAGKRLVRMTHGSLSPIYLTRQSPLKKKLVSPIERYFLRSADKVVVTCQAEKGWIESYLGRRRPPIEITDIKRFFNLNPTETLGQTLNLTLNSQQTDTCRPLHILYLGRRHPLKGLEYLEAAVQGLTNADLLIVSDAFGDELEKVWDWCDVLVLPTLSENFGLVIAEALERCKHVITTDGAPAWGDGNDYCGRLVYLKGFRDGTNETRVSLLREAIGQLTKRRNHV